MDLHRAPHWSSALVLVALGCSGSTRTADPAPVAPVAPVVTPAPVEPDAGPAVAVEPTVVDAGAPVAEAPMPPMPEGLRAPARPWARMSDQEKGRHMREAVMPAMTALLQAYDPVEFANVTCATCHGDNARAVHFHMPNSLPRLPAFGTPASQEHMAAHRRMYEFMGTRVVPAMAQLLGQQPYDMQTHRGFGCANCHASEAAGAAPTAH
ncbi:MAG: hypothetical protein Q8S73_31950 [Deltaproteobacteria bacterium]|nr:hypothetical protein [Myxococcales bacterium]MDP3218760.1 hypothetical protein [Deltaproteobacteria bacterium]